MRAAAGFLNQDLQDLQD